MGTSHHFKGSEARKPGTNPDDDESDAISVQAAQDIYDQELLKKKQLYKKHKKSQLDEIMEKEMIAKSFSPQYVANPMMVAGCSQTDSKNELKQIKVKGVVNYITPLQY